ncbi:nucleotidyltransferase family protein [bacterium]|nr:nucleotidyltransferase family protein [bacterium]
MSTTSAKAEKLLQKHKADLQRRFKVSRIGIFGSYSRNEVTDESDVDVLVEFSEPIGWDFVELLEFLENLLGRRVDLVTPNALKAKLRDKILSEVLYI